MVNKEEIIRKHFLKFSDKQWKKVKDTFPYSEITSIIDDAVKETTKDFLEEYSDNEEENITVALLEAVWISRWHGPDALVAVLEPEEAEKIVKDIHMELAKIGYEIRKKDA
jgi:hypothetical protein